MNVEELVTYYFSRTVAIVNKMRIHGDKIKDITIIEKIYDRWHQNLIVLCVQWKKLMILMNYPLMNCKVPC
jgi:hypothetical protein